MGFGRRYSAPIASRLWVQPAFSEQRGLPGQVIKAQFVFVTVDPFQQQIGEVWAQRINVHRNRCQTEQTGQ